VSVTGLEPAFRVTGTLPPAFFPWITGFLMCLPNLYRPTEQ
jgi:hypothetical protein